MTEAEFMSFCLRIENDFKEYCNRVDILEKAVRENAINLAENTRMTSEMYEVFETARSGFKIVGRVGDTFISISDFIERRRFTLLLLTCFAIMSYSMAATGHLPDWLFKFIKAAFL